MATVIDPLIGTRVGNYQIVSLLGKGGMARVYRATHPEIGSEVALKVLSYEVAELDEVVRRFRIEAQAVNKIAHPHIIKIFDFGTLPDGRPYYLMELLAGESLADHIRRVRKMPLAEAIAVLDVVLDALGAIHAAQIVHRDLKPDNVFLGRGGVKLLDFGIIKLLGDTGTGKTQTGALLGTPAYMAPEQCEGRQKDVGPQTDLYSAGCMMYQMLSGELPFDAESLAGLLVQHLTHVPVPLRERLPELPAGVSDVVAQCLAKDPAARPASAAEVRERLLPFLKEMRGSEALAGTLAAIPVTSLAPVAATAQSIADDEAPPRRPRSRAPIVVGGVVGIVAVAVGAAVLLGAGHRAAEPVVVRDAAPAAVVRPAIDAAPPVDAPPPPPPPTTIDAAPPTLTDRLKVLKALLDHGEITQPEYKKRRAEILKNL